jgi:hypothetical protein
MALFSESSKRQVFISYQHVFNKERAKLRKLKPIQKVVKAHYHALKSSTPELDSETVGQIVQILLQDGAFSSKSRARELFPDLYKRASSTTTSILGDGQPEGGSIVEIENTVKFSEQVEQGEITSSESRNTTSLLSLSFPYGMQHQILTYAQRILEQVCFDFAMKWMPNLLKEKGWDTPEAVELNMWGYLLSKCDLPANAVDSGIAELTEDLFLRINQIRHSAVHRLPTSTMGIKEMVEDATRFAEAFRDQERTATLRELQLQLISHAQELEMHKKKLENRRSKRVQAIRAEQAELQSRVAALDMEEFLATEQMIDEFKKHQLDCSSEMGKSVQKVFAYSSRLGFDHDILTANTNKVLDSRDDAREVKNAHGFAVDENSVGDIEWDAASDTSSTTRDSSHYKDAQWNMVEQNQVHTSALQVGNTRFPTRRSCRVQ